MKKSILLAILICTFIFSQINILKAGDGDDKDPKNKNRVSKFVRDHQLAVKEFNYKTGKLVNFYLDFQLGVASTNANVTSMAGTGAYKTESKLGYTTGVLFYLNILDMLSFSSGLTFNGKSFGLTTPSLIPPGVDTNLLKPNSTSYIAANYLDIPLYFNIGGMLSEKVGLWFNGGPYLGILISSPNNNVTGLGYKNFDFGLSGTLTANYVFAYPFSVILGTNFKYGGLNNLGSTNMVDKITTTNYSFFSGIRLAF